MLILHRYSIVHYQWIRVRGVFLGSWNRQYFPSCSILPTLFRCLWLRFDSDGREVHIVVVTGDDDRLSRIGTGASMVGFI